LATNSDNSLSRLLDIMASLRDPVSGCPWDKEQTINSLLPYTIEEVYEVADAIGRDNMAELCDELGDLLFQIVFYAQIAQESGNFTFYDVADHAVEKLTRRHPHVFADQKSLSTAAQQLAWEQHKREERRVKHGDDPREQSVLDGVTHGLPAFIRAVKLQKRAAKVGFDWPDAYTVMDKVKEEITEVREVLDHGAERAPLMHEIGDLLLAVTNLARYLEIDPELALHQANNRFEKRFRNVEASLVRRGRKPQESTLEEMEALWQEVKLLEEKPD
jgi:nucleoside triphosphate diphosphatase